MRGLRIFADRLGICLSGLCVIHCLLTPIVIAFMPSLGLFEMHETFHDVLLFVLPVLSILAFVPGYRRHHDKSVFYWSLPGLGFIAAGTLIFHDDLIPQAALTIIGSVLLIKAHLSNRKLCACCEGHTHAAAPFRLRRP